ncbi:MAG: trypsin-like peptidase domain-containing protein [Okeania sp. SIO3B5]|uniref:trypsin-like peptidase domain-containing protein n=1 Tax=Okeania sp. SIO3B5 TaxID=2607811 RepID=UPI0013FF7EA2|nr:trypsin-like peptidase domain-containing protein [Okeania sp. SIO3B5]NEO58309.1 trypsin-like peptidase domain-containing protein [Okeania sp. SIO3B5]
MKIIIPSLKDNLCILGFLISFNILILNCSSTAQSRVHSETLSNLHAAKLGKTKIKDEICEIAKSKTVLILSEDNRSQGTGFLIEKKRSNNGSFVYKVVTNGHVLTQAKSYKIQTSDKNYYKASKLYSFGTALSGRDLTTLQFESTKNYEIPKLAHGEKLSPKTPVIAAGYPLRTGEVTQSNWVCEQGKVSIVLDRPMQGGYRIGYEVNIRKGMSGGPLFNFQGQIVGINGRHSNPPFGGRNLYKYEDGTPVEEKLELLKKSSWAIPMEELVPRAMSKGICLAYDDREKPPDCKVTVNQTPTNPKESESQAKTLPPEPSNSSAVRNGETPENYDAGSVRSDLNDDELEELAKKITVRVKVTKIAKINDKIEGSEFIRSGFVVDKKPKGVGHVYTVIVYLGQKTELENRVSLEQTKDSENSISLDIVPPNDTEVDTKRPGINTTREEISISGGDKLLRLEFFGYESEGNYETAKPRFSPPKSGDEVFVSGYKKVETMEEGEFEFIKGRVQSFGNSNENRIYLSHSKVISEEMLGGPLINSKGEVIGINTSGSSSNSSGSAILIQELQKYLSKKDTLIDSKKDTLTN